jgi:hypothetical protein
MLGQRQIAATTDVRSADGSNQKKSAVKKTEKKLKPFGSFRLKITSIKTRVLYSWRRSVSDAPKDVSESKEDLYARTNLSTSQSGVATGQL